MKRSELTNVPWHLDPSIFSLFKYGYMAQNKIFPLHAEVFSTHLKDVIFLESPEYILGFLLVGHRGAQTTSPGSFLCGVTAAVFWSPPKWPSSSPSSLRESPDGLLSASSLGLRWFYSVGHLIITELNYRIKQS